MRAKLNLYWRIGVVESFMWVVENHCGPLIGLYSVPLFNQE